MTYTAQMSQRRGAGGRTVWKLYVCIVPGPVSDWPEHVWRRTAIPTPAERRDWLRRLGYAPAGPEQWDWTEDEDANEVVLIASVAVVPLAG